MFFIQGSVASCIHWRLWWLSVACVVLSFTCLPQEKCAFHVFVCHWENAKKTTNTVCRVFVISTFRFDVFKCFAKYPTKQKHHMAQLNHYGRKNKIRKSELSADESFASPSTSQTFPQNMHMCFNSWIFF